MSFGKKFKVLRELPKIYRKVGDDKIKYKRGMTYISSRGEL